MRTRIGFGVCVTLMLVAVAAQASIFVPWSFDKVVNESDAVVRGTVLRTWSAWDDAGQTIYTWADIQVGNWLAGSGRQTITIREIGGTVNGYTQEAIDFPVLRAGEEVLLFLTHWDDTGEFRIQAYNQGKYLVRHDSSGRETLIHDVRTQGNDQPSAEIRQAAENVGVPMDEFEMTLGAALKGRTRQLAE